MGDVAFEMQFCDDTGSGIGAPSAGYTTFVQAWDFRPGQNFVHQMQQGISSCRQTIAVLTPAYFESGFTQAEWYSAFARDPTGKERPLLPVRMEECDVEGLLGQIIYIDLVGLDNTQARERLLAGIDERRAKPPQPPEIFPDDLDRNKRVIPPLPPPSPEDRRGLLILLDMVRQFWVESVMKQYVQHEALIDLGKETKIDAVEHPWEQVLELPDAAGKPLPADTRITDVFEDVGRLLLILGEPGSGKTITLLELARDLVAVAHQSSDLRQPVPVVFNLSSWTERFTSLTDWLADELNTKYRIRKRIGRSWLDANRLVLLLDGLDEVKADRRAACIRAINAFLQDQGTTGLVVCSRLTEYTAEPIRLKMNGAICLQPLTATQIETYLLRLGSQLDALRAELNKDDVLQDLAQSPLMLSVMTLAYQGASINALAGDVIETPEARRRQVFNTYIDRMFARKGNTAGSAHAKEQTKRCLSWLAHNMLRRGQIIFMIEQIQPSWLNNVRQILIYLLSSRTATAAFLCATLYLVLGVLQIVGAIEYVYAPSPQPPPGAVAIFLPASSISLFSADLTTILLGAFCSSSIDLLRHHIETQVITPCILKVVNNTLLLICANLLGWVAVAFVIYTLFFFGREWVIEFAFAYVLYGLVFWITSCRRSVSRDIRIYDLPIWSWAGPLMVSIPAFIFAFILIVTFLLASQIQVVNDIVIHVLDVVEYQTDVAAPLSLHEAAVILPILYFLLWPSLFFLFGIRRAVHDGKEIIINSGIRSAVVNACRFGLLIFACSMLGAFTLSLFAPSSFGILFATCVIASILVALAYGGVDVLNHYVLRLIVYRNRYLPKRLHQFLDQCAKLVFLRRVGGGYIFIHKLLLEHFAAMWEAEDKQKGTEAAVTSGSAVAAPN